MRQRLRRGWLIVAGSIVCAAIVFVVLRGVGGGSRDGPPRDPAAGAMRHGTAGVEAGFDEEYWAFKSAFGRSTAEGLAMLAALDDYSSRQYRLRQLLAAEAISHEQAFLVAMGEKDPMRRDILLEQLFTAMGQRGDLRVLELAERIDDERARKVALAAFSNFAQIRSDRDALAILQWAAERGEIERDGLGPGIWRIFQPLQTKEAVRQAAAIGGDWLMGTCVSTLACLHLGESGPKVGYEEMMKEPGFDAATAQDIYCRILARNIDPERASGILDDTWLPEPAKDKLRTLMAAKLFVDDPGKALGWLDGLSGVQTASPDMYFELRDWAAKDTMEASRRIGGIRSPWLRQAASVALSTVLRKAGDHAAADEWAKHADGVTEASLIRPSNAYPIRGEEAP